MKEEIYKLYEVCKRFNSRLGYSLEENKKLKDFKELINKIYSIDISKNLDYFDKFKEIDFKNTNQKYTIKFTKSFFEKNTDFKKFYYELLSSMANFSSYFADLLEIIFDLNKRRRFKMGEITKEELVSSDEIILDDEDDESGN